MSSFKILNTNFVESEINDEIVVLNIQTGEYIGLNNVAKDIWNYCKNNEDIQHIVNLIKLEYNISEEKALNDVMDFLHSLHDEQLIELCLP
ncbi:MAG TPA: PqqD family protein [Candidatus Paceibacterota bacterium]